MELDTLHSAYEQAFIYNNLQQKTNSPSISWMPKSPWKPICYNNFGEKKENMEESVNRKRAFAVSRWGLKALHHHCLTAEMHWFFFKHTAVFKKKQQTETCYETMVDKRHYLKEGKDSGHNTITMIHLYLDWPAVGYNYLRKICTLQIKCKCWWKWAWNPLTSHLAFKHGGKVSS